MFYYYIKQQLPSISMECDDASIARACSYPYLRLFFCHVKHKQDSRAEGKGSSTCVKHKQDSRAEGKGSSTCVKHKQDSRAEGKG